MALEPAMGLASSGSNAASDAGSNAGCDAGCERAIAALTPNATVLEPNAGLGPSPRHDATLASGLCCYRHCCGFARHWYGRCRSPAVSARTAGLPPKLCHLPLGCTASHTTDSKLGLCCAKRPTLRRANYPTARSIPANFVELFAQLFPPCHSRRNAANAV